MCRRSCTRNVGRPISTIAWRHLTARFQFSSPSREPSGEVIAGSPGLRPASRVVRRGMTRSGMGIERRPADDFGLPSTSLP